MFYVYIIYIYIYIDTHTPHTHTIIIIFILFFVRNSVLRCKKWMLAIEGKVFFPESDLPDMSSAFSVLFGPITHA